jgi:hypothetical protein
VSTIRASRAFSKGRLGERTHVLLGAAPWEGVNDLVKGFFCGAFGLGAATLVLEVVVAGQRPRRFFETAFVLVYMLVIHADLSWFELMILIVRDSYCAQRRLLPVEI